MCEVTGITVPASTLYTQYTGYNSYTANLLECCCWYDMYHLTTHAVDLMYMYTESNTSEPIILSNTIIHKVYIYM